MIAALFVSTAFLTSYLIYHYHVGSVAFTGQGWIRPHHPGYYDSPLGSPHGLSRLQIAVRQTRRHRALDVPALDVRVGDRRDRLSDALSDVGLLLVRCAAQSPQKEHLMVRKQSRRDFLKQTSLVVAATGGIVGNVWGADTRVVADTAFGKIRGVDTGGIKIFKGVPYGANTAGKNRFMPPARSGKWTGVRDALEFGPSAPQTEPGARRAASDLAVAGAGLRAEGEDCLVLNIWTPAINDGRKRPVMLWCHGGGFATGSGSSPVTEGTNLARRGDVVVVTINHRLNVLGFTYLAEFGGQDFSQSGDVGMLDIVHALKWVRDNIAQFGGDPNTVTVFGQSGGGRKVGTLLAMPSAKGLFHRAIIESGPTIKLVERNQATRVAGELLAKLGLNKSQVRELQNLPVDKVMGAYFAVMRSMNVDQMTMGFSPTVDGNALPRHPFQPTAADVVAERAAHARIHPHGVDQRRRCRHVFDVRRQHARAHPKPSGRKRRPRDRRLSQGEPGRDAVRPLFPDRERQPVRSAGDEDRRAAGGPRQGSRVSVLLPLGIADRRRAAEVAAHH